ncbi:hypothetical protein DFR70_101387 [Nocardia tenerifensis]|uniref:DUF8020 domain-containing protein n=1 Tax=Nocardia tenerifensis TaxID=228006 RepID=A0A318KA40_9NOCA|nr:hypothetical protein [Nocardia tenerifensis]PXX70966.1 hypothetical protein DFR70_101387 [Nocardia tenerifensis]
MNVKQRVLAATATAAALSTLTATASAQPTGIEHHPDVRYLAQLDGDTAVITVGQPGTLHAEDGQLQIRTPTGQVLAGIPLELRVDDVAFPIDATVYGNTARLTPDLNPARAQYKPIAAPPSAERAQDAVDRVSSTIAKGVGVGSLLGAAGAGILGCLLGGTAAAVATAPLALLLGAGPALGCLIGAATLAPGGALTGALNAAAPVAIPAFIEYFTTLNT